MGKENAGEIELERGYNDDGHRAKSLIEMRSLKAFLTTSDRATGRSSARL